MDVLRELALQRDEVFTWAHPGERAGDDRAALAAEREAERLVAEQRTCGATAFPREPSTLSWRRARGALAVQQIGLVPQVGGGSR